MEGVIEGRVVHFVLESGEHRPALIVNAWHEGGGENGLVNLQVVLDGTNDQDDGRAPPERIPPGASRYNRPNREDCLRGSLWRTSIHYSAEPLEGTWHWPEKA